MNMTLAGLALSGVFAVTATSAYAAQWTFDPNQTKVELKALAVPMVALVSFRALPIMYLKKSKP